MARVGYIMSFKHLEEDLKADIQWMNDHGCCKIFIEDEHNEAMRIVWKDMLECLACGDEIVISKFSHAIRGSREFSVFCDYLRREKVDVISIHDEMDTKGKTFPPKSLTDFMNMLATLPTETMALRQAHEHKAKLIARKHPRTLNQQKTDRNNKIVRMYQQGESIDKIWKMSGFKSRQSVFNVLDAAGVDFNRGHSKKELQDRSTKEELQKIIAMTDKELAYELFGRYNGDEIMYRHNKCYLELAHHLLQEDKDCDLYPHVAFAMANELYKDAGDTFNESYMQAAVEGFEKLQNPSDDVKAKLAKAKDVIARAQQSRQLYMENMSHRVLDKRVESMIEGAEYLLKYTPLIKEEGVYIHDIFIHNDDDYDLLSIDVIIDIEESDSDKVHHLKLHVEDIDKFEFERENFGLFVFDFTVMPYEYEHKFCPIQKSCLIEASFDEVGFITAATVTVEELTDEQLRTQTAR